MLYAFLLFHTDPFAQSEYQIKKYVNSLKTNLQQKLLNLIRFHELVIRLISIKHKKETNYPSSTLKIITLHAKPYMVFRETKSYNRKSYT